MAETQVLQLVLEKFIPHSLNDTQRMHRYRRARVKKVWEQAIWGKVNEDGGPGWRRPPLGCVGGQGSGGPRRRSRKLAGRVPGGAQRRVGH